jgi:hypothetical protein
MQPPPPPPPRDIRGVAELDSIRIRRGFFSLKAERLCEGPDGARFWRPISVGDWIEIVWKRP